MFDYSMFIWFNLSFVAYIYIHTYIYIYIYICLSVCVYNFYLLCLIDKFIIFLRSNISTIFFTKKGIYQQLHSFHMIKQLILKDTRNNLMQKIRWKWTWHFGHVTYSINSRMSMLTNLCHTTTSLLFNCLK